MSNYRRKFSIEYKVDAAYRVINYGRSIAQVTQELSINVDTLRSQVRSERRKIEVVKGKDLEL